MTALRPARITFDDDGAAHAPDFGDRYHPRIGAAAQAQHVFLAGNHLPARWAGTPGFTILETGFGLGHNFLATWDAWRRDPARGERLHFISIEAHPPTRKDLQRGHVGSPWPDLAATLHEAWPPLTPGLHALTFEVGRVRLLLALGDVQAMQRQIDASVDAYFLDGFAPDRNPAMWDRHLLQALARKARPGATAATWSVAREVTDGLRAAGFEVERAPGVGGKREVTRARWAPRSSVRQVQRTAAAARQAVVIGAGLAGAWAARALAGSGWQVRVVDRHAQPAQEASGNPAGLFHATVHADDGVHARFNRAAALTAARTMRAWIAAGQVPGAVDGLLRLAAPGERIADLRARLSAIGPVDDFVQLLDAPQAGARAGLPLDRPAWYFAQAGWVDPAALVAHLLRTSGVDFRGGVEVSALRRDGETWTLLDTHGATVASAPVVVLANGADALRLWPGAGWPIGQARGQLSLWPAPGPSAPALPLPLAGEGYALRQRGGALLCGATVAHGDDEPALRKRDHRFNVDRLSRLTGWRPDDELPWQGRVGWRVQTPDRLPIVGPVAAVTAATSMHGGATRMSSVLREPGLFVLTALGSRGLTWAPLAGEVVAAWASGTPMPLEARLRDAIDPARWVLRAARRQR